MGEKLPSVRKMAAMWSVSPDTIQRVYSQLEQASLIETKRGLGTYVTDDENWIKHFRAELVQQKTETFVKEMKDIGFTVREIIAFLNTKHSDKRSGKLCIENADDAGRFLSDFEKFAKPDENGNCAVSFKNEADFWNEEVWITLFKSEDKWFFRTHGDTWTPLLAKEVPNIIPFILRHAKTIANTVNKLG